MVVTIANQLSRGRSSAARGRSPRTRACVRVIVAIALFMLWGLSALTGFLLYVASEGPRSGWVKLLFLTKRGWVTSTSGSAWWPPS